MTAELARRLDARERMVGYWVTSDNPVATERIALAGYDYVCLDLQRGLIDYAGAVRGLTAIDGTGAAGVVRVPSSDAALIGRALDAGAQAVVVPLVDSTGEAAQAARACRYPGGGGVRSSAGRGRRLHCDGRDTRRDRGRRRDRRRAGR